MVIIAIFEKYSQFCKKNGIYELKNIIWEMHFVERRMIQKYL